MKAVVQRFLDTHVLPEQKWNGVDSGVLAMDALLNLPSKGKVAILCSGGVDSAVLLALAALLRYSVHAIQFTKAGRSEIECEAAMTIAQRFAQTTSVVPYPTPASVEESAAKLPERYSVYFSVAAAEAERVGADHVVSGLIYEDWTMGDVEGAAPDIVVRMNTLLKAESPYAVTILAPLTFSSKATVCALGILLGLNEADTVSCGNGNGGRACGDCQQCLERKQAFLAARVLLNQET